MNTANTQARAIALIEQANTQSETYNDGQWEIEQIVSPATDMKGGERTCVDGKRYIITTWTDRDSTTVSVFSMYGSWVKRVSISDEVVCSVAVYQTTPAIAR